MNDQRSLKDQLDDLEKLAVKNGMYDAHDWLIQKRAQLLTNTRDEKLEEIARGVLDVPTLTLSNPFTVARVEVCNLKQALQLAYQAGQDSK